jgi:ribosomal protein S27AE
MEFFSKLGETLSEAGREVTQKGKELTGLAKLNLDIRSKEEFIQRQYAHIGSKYFEEHEEDLEPAYEEMLLIKEAKEEIYKMEQERAVLKGLKKCPSCGRALPEQAKYCLECGKEYETEYEEE